MATHNTDEEDERSPVSPLLSHDQSEGGDDKIALYEPDDDGHAVANNGDGVGVAHLPAKSRQPRYHLVNLIMMSVCFFFVFTAYSALQNLQASLNTSGKTCLAVLYGMLLVSCFITPPLVQRLSPRITMVICMSIHCAFTAANYYPSEYVLLPACGLLGLASAPLWTAQQIYVTTSAHMYHEYTKTPAATVGSSKQGSAAAAGEAESTIDKVLGRFNGIFFLIFQFTQIAGNLISSLALHATGAGQQLDENATCSHSNATGNNTSSGTDVKDSVRYTLLSVYLACDVAGVLLCLFCLRSLSKSVSEYKATDLKSSCLATLRRVIDPYMLLLIPVVIYSGMQQAYIFAEFTKYYITDCLGIGWVGYVMLVLGVVDAASSLLCGRLAAHVGRVPIVLAGALVNAALIAFLIIWIRKPDLLAVFIVASSWGFVDAVWNTQLNTVFGIIFARDQESAFANYRLWQSAGFCISFAYGNALEMPVKLWILVGVLSVSVTLYIVSEIRWYREQKRSKYL
ncbi:protein unc-93 homolog A-like [Sycon ciliatum]|uniref:protein unc-93 homolog A-like n=1 Tax=Sycon ciliatum TaxID=27933 RepID=UPI0031F65556